MLNKSVYTAHICLENARFRNTQKQILKKSCHCQCIVSYLNHINPINKLFGMDW